MSALTYRRASDATLTRLSYDTGLAVSRAWSYGTTSFDFVTLDHVHGTWLGDQRLHTLHTAPPDAPLALCHASCPPVFAEVYPLEIGQAGDVDPLLADLPARLSPAEKEEAAQEWRAREARRRRAMCTGKTRFRDRTAAELALSQIDKGPGGPRSTHEPNRVYREPCPFCDGFHLTSQGNRRTL